MSQKLIKPADKRLVADAIISKHGISERRACRLLDLPRNTRRYSLKENSVDEEIKEEMVTLAARWKRFGYRRINIMLMRKSGIYINHKKAYRLYKEANLSIHKRSKKKRYEKRGMPSREHLSLANDRWSMDFVIDVTRFSRNFRVFALIDEVTRESLTLEVESSMGGAAVAMYLDKVALSEDILKKYLQIMVLNLLAMH